MGVGYVTFSIENPNLFHLMFGAEMTQYERDTVDFPYLEALNASNQVIDMAVVNAFDENLMNDKRKFTAAKAAAFSIVHGLSLLIVNQRLATPPPGTKAFRDFLIETFTVFDERVFKRNR
jgi:hypothetical protein